jgi:hypothetical protein
MRMVHYHLALSAVLAPALLITAATGIWHDGSQVHLGLGVLTAMLAVATQTLLILFMIVTGRILKEAMRSRPLAPDFLAELNRFFSERRAYPVALGASALAVATAVLGYGSRIGVPPAVHMLLGLFTVVVNLATIPAGQRTLRGNQELLDRVAGELDRIDAELAARGAAVETPEIRWTVGLAARRLVFAASAWLPYLYWGLVVWRGDFARVPAAFLAATAALSFLGLASAWRARGRAPAENGG